MIEFPIGQLTLPLPQGVLVLLFGTGFVGLGIAGLSWRRYWLRGNVARRLFQNEQTEVSAATAIRKATRIATRMATARQRPSPLRRPFFWVPWLAILPVGLTLYFLVGWSWPFCVSTAAISGLVGSQLEGFLATRRSAKLESGLADAIDIMVGALAAGAGTTTALEAAVEESPPLLRRELSDVCARIRFGDSPPAVFEKLAARIPLETFLLFSTTLSVHWEVGGSLASTLATVGRTVRDRMDIARRIRSNIAQSQISTIMVLGLTYFIALIVYFNGPEQMETFLATSIGQFLTAGTMMLQAVGIVWMSWISRMRF